MSEIICGPDKVRGRVRAHTVIPEYRAHEAAEPKELWTPQSEFKRNQILNQWGTIVSKLLASGDSRYRIAGLYLEFENTASSGDPVSIPTFDRSRDITYYDDLSGNPGRDYLRVAMTANQLLSDGEGFASNQNVFFARSSGTTGVHGKTFSASVNSTIFGASLVAFIDNNDATQDLLLSSFYFDVADQQQKLSTSQIGVEWELTFQ